MQEVLEHATQLLLSLELLFFTCPDLRTSKPYQEGWKKGSEKGRKCQNRAKKPGQLFYNFEHNSNCNPYFFEHAQFIKMLQTTLSVVLKCLRNRLHTEVEYHKYNNNLLIVLQILRDFPNRWISCIVHITHAQRQKNILFSLECQIKKKEDLNQTKKYKIGSGFGFHPEFPRRRNYGKSERIRAPTGCQKAQEETVMST